MLAFVLCYLYSYTILLLPGMLCYSPNIIQVSMSSPTSIITLILLISLLLEPFSTNVIPLDGAAISDIPADQSSRDQLLSDLVEQQEGISSADNVQIRTGSYFKQSQNYRAPSMHMFGSLKFSMLPGEEYQHSFLGGKFKRLRFL